MYHDLKQHGCNFAAENIFYSSKNNNLMRFKLTLQTQPEVMGRELPINYQYPLQGVIYHTLGKSDFEFSTWLHENGYQLNGKSFKLFTFSNLIVPQYGIDKQRERLIVKSDIVTLYITFLPEKSTQQFIQGLFQQQTIQLADYISGVQFMVREIQVMPPLDYHPDMAFRTLSPVCISLRNERGHMDYLSPTDPRSAQRTQVRPRPHQGRHPRRNPCTRLPLPIQTRPPRRTHAHRLRKRIG